MSMAGYAEELRARAVTLRWSVDERGAAMLERIADEIEDRLQDEADALLELREAERESGRSRRTLSRWIANGAIRNHGTEHRPRVRRGDLPIRARTLRVEESDTQLVTRRQIALSVANQGKRDGHD